MKEGERNSVFGKLCQVLASPLFSFSRHEVVGPECQWMYSVFCRIVDARITSGRFVSLGFVFPSFKC